MPVSFSWNRSDFHFSLGLGLSLVCECPPPPKKIKINKRSWKQKNKRGKERGAFNFFCVPQDKEHHSGWSKYFHFWVNCPFKSYCQLCRSNKRSQICPHLILSWLHKQALLCSQIQFETEMMQQLHQHWFSKINYRSCSDSRWKLIP